MTAAAILGGVLFVLRKVPRGSPSATREKRRGSLRAFAGDISPIAAIIASIIFLHGALGMKPKDSLMVALLVAIVLTLGISRLKMRIPPIEALKSIPVGGILRLVYVIIGLMVFRGTIDNSGAVTEISDMMRSYQVPLFPFVVVLSFICGLVTGLAMAYVAIVFPLLTPLVLQVTPDPLPFLVLAFGSGFIGVLFSPVHVCLILTHQYFKSDFSSVYRGMIGPVIVVFAMLIALFLMLYLTPLSG